MKREFERLKEQKDDDPFMRRKALPTLVAAKLRKGQLIDAKPSGEQAKPATAQEKPTDSLRKNVLMFSNIFQVKQKKKFDENQSFA